MGVSRQAYYKKQKTEFKKLFEEQIVINNVQEERREQPKVGGKKLHLMLNNSGTIIGRDKLFKILKNNNLLIKPRKRYIYTTQSNHRFRKYSNLIKDLEITRPNQVFVADITYIDTLEGFCYLALITDAYSRKILGYDLSKSLAIEGCQRALKMAMKNVAEPEKLIHHSDRGIQYCSTGYVKMLLDKNVKISMTEDNHCYENALAERVFNTLKNEFMLGDKLQSFDIAKELVNKSIKTYNEKRLHMSLNYETPAYKYAA